MVSDTAISNSSQSTPEINQKTQQTTTSDSNVASADQSEVLAESKADTNQSKKDADQPEENTDQLEENAVQSEEDAEQLEDNPSLPDAPSKPDSGEDSKKEKSWKAPIFMLLSLLAATLLAVFHDGMNYRLDGTIVSSGAWSQQWTSRYGNALAFLIKTLFITCTGTAYVQRQWLTLATNQRPTSVRDIDILSSATSSAFALLPRVTWLQNPVLLVIVCICWILPLSAIITPGTLTVEPQPHNRTEDHMALQLSFGFMQAQFVQNPPYDDYARTTFSIDVGQLLPVVVFASVASSQILPIKSDHANQTFFTNFTGPALKCTDSNSTINTIATNFAQDNEIVYLSWIGDNTPWSQTKNLTLSDPTLHDYIFNSSDPEVYDSALKNETKSDNTLWILRKITSWGGPAEFFYLQECQLWNATYEVEFTYINFEQTTVIHNFTYQNPVLTISTPNKDNFVENKLVNQFPKSILAAFASLLIGVDHQKTTEGYWERSNVELLNIDWSGSGLVNDGLEEVFKNITLSLFSIQNFLANTTDTTSRSITDWSNTYLYDRRDLLLTYGISFLASLLCFVLGMHSFIRNGTGFSNKFSTYIRAAEGSDLDIRTCIVPGDTGADPLPKRISKKIIIMASKKTC